jgi:hypothetical protein
MGAGPSGAGKAPDAAAGEKKKKGQLREAAGQRWRDPTLDEWPKNDFRIFVGDLGNDVNDDVLAKAFQKYPSFAKAKVTLILRWTGQDAVGQSKVWLCREWVCLYDWLPWQLITACRLTHLLRLYILLPVGGKRQENQEEQGLWVRQLPK